MTEKEKMQSQLLYDADNDKKLIGERVVAKKLCYEFNQCRPDEASKQESIIKKLFGNVKGSFALNPTFWCDYGYNISIGDKFYANHNLVILDCAKVTIGDNVFIGPNCGIYTAAHPIDFETRNLPLEYALPVTIGDNVWLGGNVVINPGVTIGSNVVIGSGSVVTKDIPDNVVAVGNPCRVLRPITEKDKENILKRKV